MLLRPVADSDLPILFKYQQDPVAARMAAFGTVDGDVSDLAARWKAALSDGSSVQRAIVEEGIVAGFVATYRRAGQLEVTYWVARSHWGRGLATAALSELLRIVSVRPLHASTARDNVASARVLEKCGFIECGVERAFAGVRGKEIDEVFFELA